MHKKLFVMLAILVATSLNVSSIAQMPADRPLAPVAAPPAPAAATAPPAIDLANDLFQDVVTQYRTANPKPQLPEAGRKFKVQAEFSVQEKQFDKAVGLYGEALKIAPWWPEGYFNRALILGATEKYYDAMREMKRYLLLVPDAPNARIAQDKIYQWEGAAPEKEEAKKYAWLLGAWEVTGSWFSKAPFDYGERHNSFQAEFSKSGSSVDGYVIIKGAKSGLPAYRYTVSNSEELPTSANWQIHHDRNDLPLTSFTISSDKKTMILVFLAHTFVFIKN